MIYTTHESLNILNILTILFLTHVNELSLGMLVRSILKVELKKVFGTNRDLFCALFYDSILSLPILVDEWRNQFLLARMEHFS